MPAGLLVHNHFENGFCLTECATESVFIQSSPRKMEGHFFLGPKGTFAAICFFFSSSFFFFTFTIYSQSFCCKKKNR